ncbi:MAG: T9SS type A sorting domain-containing protein, partial [Bacteroidota bacterium]|nr:T9SS type A sorting domain-containing protein [Bacteroidota bacterium]
SFWEDYTHINDSYHYVHPLVSYRIEDTLYSNDIETQQIHQKVFQNSIVKLYPVHSNIIVNTIGESILLDLQLQPLKIWDNSHPINFSTSISLDSFIVGIHTVDNRLLHVVNAYTEETIDLNLASLLDKIDTLQSREDIVFVQGHLDNQVRVLQYNSKFELLSNSALDSPDENYNFSFTFYPDRVYSWRTAGQSRYKANYRVVSKYPDANPIQYIDIALDSVWIDSIFQGPPEQQSPAKVIFRANISNYSSDTIRSLIIHYEDFEVQCFNGVYDEDLTNLLILPNSTGQIVFQDDVWQIPVLSFIRRYYIQHANHHLDADIQNNHFDVVYISSGIAESESSRWTAFPNPFSNAISTNADTEKLILYNSSGQIVATGRSNIEGVAHLPPGTYILKAILKTGIHTIAMIKSQ